VLCCFFVRLGAGFRVTLVVRDLLVPPIANDSEGLRRFLNCGTVIVCTVALFRVRRMKAFCIGRRRQGANA
jgi:hypothetical protein